MSSFRNDLQSLSTKKDDDNMLDVIVRLGKWRGVGIGLFYFVCSLILFSYGVYSLVRYKEATGTVQESGINPNAFQSVLGANLNSYKTAIHFPISDTDTHTSTITTSIQYPKDTQLSIIYDTRTLDVQISNNTYSWLATIAGLIGMIGSVIYMLLSLKSRAFQTTVGLYGQLL